MILLCKNTGVHTIIHMKNKSKILHLHVFN